MALEAAGAGLAGAGGAADVVNPVPKPEAGACGVGWDEGLEKKLGTPAGFGAGVGAELPGVAEEEEAKKLGTPPGLDEAGVDAAAGCGEAAGAAGLEKRGLLADLGASPPPRGDAKARGLGLGGAKRFDGVLADVEGAVLSSVRVIKGTVGAAVRLGIVAFSLSFFSCSNLSSSSFFFWFASRIFDIALASRSCFSHFE